jgi:rhodanese-related sulfurtransferase
MESSTVVFSGAVAAFILIKFLQGLRLKKAVPQWLSRGAIIIDVRTRSEFATAANPHSMNIPLDQLEGKATTLPKDKPFIVCCASGMRSAAAKAILNAKGFKEVLNAGPWTRTLIVILLMVPFLPPSSAGEWIKTGEEAGVVIYKRDLPGSDVVAIRGEAVIEESMSRIVGVLENIERGKEWMADIVESYNIEKHTETDRWEYNRTKTPWPLQDRDFVIHTRTRFTKDPEPRLIIEMTSGQNRKKPVLSGVVRGELLDSRFILKFIDAKKTHLTCEIQADPKGVIPKWVVNLFQRHWPLATIRGLRKQLQKPDIVENQNLARLLEKP